MDIQRKLKQCFEKCEYKSKEIDKYLPQILTQYPTNQFRVCEKTLSYELFSWDQLVSIEKPNANKFTAIELFAGAGGLSIGLEKAGISVVLANEIMPDFAATLKANHPNTNVINADIHEINFREELKKIGLDSVDVLSGGPPCQGFSTIGAKINKTREIHCFTNICELYKKPIPNTQYLKMYQALKECMEDLLMKHLSKKWKFWDMRLNVKF